MKQLIFAKIVVAIASLFLQNNPTSDRTISQMSDFNPQESSSYNDEQWDTKLIEIKNAMKYFDPALPVIVAVIDTGIDPDHPKLKDSLWTNLGETGVDAQGRPKATNNIDDDRNGYVDDVHGWNFANHNKEIKDSHGHGSHVSGIITRVAPHVKIMVLKYYDESSDGGMHMLNTIRSINYARKMGAHIINYSAGGLSENPQEKLAIERAGRENILFVAAAGNEGANADMIGYYPASYPLKNIVSVTAVDPKEKILKTSNYSETLVDIAAPGENILSTLPGGRYGHLTGTSQATAFVSGVAALLMRQHPHLQKPEMMVNHIIKTGVANQKLDGKVRHLSQLNAYLALTKQGDEGKILKQANTLPFELVDDLETLPIQRAPTGSF